MVMVYKVAAGYCGFLFVGTEIDMNFRTWAARACVAHLPEVVMLVAIDDMVGRQMLFPI